MFVRLQCTDSGMFNVFLNTAHISEVHVEPRFVRMSSGQGYHLTEESMAKLLRVLGIEVDE